MTACTQLAKPLSDRRRHARRVMNFIVMGSNLSAGLFSRQLASDGDGLDRPFELISYDWQLVLAATPPLTQTIPALAINAQFGDHWPVIRALDASAARSAIPKTDWAVPRRRRVLPNHWPRPHFIPRHPAGATSWRSRNPRLACDYRRVGLTAFVLTAATAFIVAVIVPIPSGELPRLASAADHRHVAVECAQHRADGLTAPRESLTCRE